jgi:hypothetical protein
MDLDLTNHELEWTGPQIPLRLEGHQGVDWRAEVPASSVPEPFALVCVAAVYAPGHAVIEKRIIVK